VHHPTTRGVGFKVLTGHGVAIDTTTSAGKLIFGIFAALAEFERELISERTKRLGSPQRGRGCLRSRSILMPIPASAC
jgi:DNA invertase Pin-like site-specific DNA recombinase